MSGRTTLIRVIVYVAVTSACTAAVGLVASNTRLAPAHSYQAMFEDVSGLAEGANVQSAGVSIGRVRSVRLRGDRALVEFTVDESIRLTTATRATVRWKDLIGNRYLELTNPAEPRPALPPGATIPPAQTAPALDLDQLSNGFRPLFKGLNPAQTNQLSTELVRVLTGQGGALRQLLEQLGNFSTGIARKDAAIGALIDNLNLVAGGLDRRRDQVGDLLIQTDRLVTGLNTDRAAITDSVARIDTGLTSITRLLTDIRPPTRTDIDQLGQLAKLINRNQAQVNKSLTKLPPTLDRLARLGSFGSYFQLYLCGIQLITDGPTGPVESPKFVAGNERCQK